MMRRTGKIGHDCLWAMAEHVRPGVTTGELNEIGARFLKEHEAVSTNKNYPTYRPGEGYPAEVCISVNEEVVHGIPGERVLHEGDVVTLDLGLRYKGYCADNAITLPVGKVSPTIQKMLDTMHEVFQISLKHLKPGKRWSEVARLMQHHAEGNGYGVVQEFVGHGIGRSMHEDPKVPNFVTPEQLKGDFKLRPGMTICIEPMLTVGKRDVVLLDDQWTVVTTDKLPSCHYEQTIAITPDGYDNLTDGRAPYGL